MIRSKKELIFYIQADRMMNRGYFKPSFATRMRNLIMPDYIMMYLEYLRKAEYYSHRSGFWSNLLANYYGLKQRKLGVKLGFSIAKDVFGYGLVIPHYGTIVVGCGNQIGNYAVLHTSTCITNGHKVIGDGLYVSTGAKVTTSNRLGNNVTIAANSVVTADISSDDVLVVGMPAQIKKESIPWYEKSQDLIRYRNKVEQIRTKYNV